MNEGGETRNPIVPVLVGAVLLGVIGGGLWYVRTLSSDTQYVQNTPSEELGNNESFKETKTVTEKDTNTPESLSSTTQTEADIPFPHNEDVAVTLPAPSPTPSNDVPVGNTPVPDPEPVVEVPPPTVVPIAPTSPYSDGTYTAIGQYHTPAGTEEIEIILTIRDGLIADASGVNRARDRKSQKYVDMFLGGFKTQVVGKKLSEVSLGKVSGASLTPKGFNAAVVKIRSEAAV